MSGLIFSQEKHRSLLNYWNYFLYISVLILFCFPSVSGQNKTSESVKEAREYLGTRGEVFLSIPSSEKKNISRLSNIISIDRIGGEYIYVYASQKGFDTLISRNLPFRVETPPSLAIKITQTEGEFPGDWKQYPTYDEYIGFIQKLAATHPDICLLDTIGFSVNNRAILALKISDNVQKDEPEPCFLYTSSMHGDELGGYYLLLRFADWLIRGYGVNAHMTGLVNRLQIWINPLSNPDGTYFMGDNSISGAKRFNLNNVDLNRNYPDPEDGPHPDGEEYQPETLAMMKFMESRHFTLSANLHGGGELVNYPWDTWAKFHPDDDWYQFISRQYADTVHKFSTHYMSDMVNGISNGYAWYTIAGGRQDWVNYFVHGREVTLELSHDKIPDTDTLEWFWECNRRSLLNYMEQAIFGIAGTVTDRITSSALRSEIIIPDHDSLNSFVFSDSISGKFYRLIKGGKYDLKITAHGYRDTMILSVPVTDFNTTILDICLTPAGSGIDIPGTSTIKVLNPFTDDLIISFNSEIQEEITVDLYDSGGRKVVHSYPVKSVAGENTIVIDCQSLVPGIYILKIFSQSISRVSLVVKSE
jgi:Zinc carboxypeptidase/Secretion system C-terminal sorting domain